eukprot:TRINITY_DN2177_c0_g1_i7.p1 TRINITY_DN2177_c0_g1~~TRINITY_DN2177_c0_g1_i7.p1  ORF type:complete len:392 (+),score=-77.95 TRINITY_DN2177_c0_g1_i7:111-1286(+)
MLREPLCASVTLQEATAPVKLPTRHCPERGQLFAVSNSNIQGWYLKDGSLCTGVHRSKPPTYPAHKYPICSVKLQQRSTGSFRLAAGRRNFHLHYNFTGSLVETAPISLRHSCRSVFNRQGISLPQDRYSYGRRLLGLQFTALIALTDPLNLPAPGRRHTIYILLRVSIVLCFWQTVGRDSLLRPPKWHTFSRTYGAILQSSLTRVLPRALEYSSHLPVSVCGTGLQRQTQRLFQARRHQGFSPLPEGIGKPLRFRKQRRIYQSSYLRPQSHYSISDLPQPYASSHRALYKVSEYQPIFHRLPLSDSAQDPTNPTMTSIAQETLGFRRRGFSPLFSLLMPACSLLSAPTLLTGTSSTLNRTLSYHSIQILNLKLRCTSQPRYIFRAESLDQ